MDNKKALVWTMPRPTCTDREAGSLSVSAYNKTLVKWLPTRVPWTSARDAANSYFSLNFIPIKLARGTAKYLKY